MTTFSPSVYEHAARLIDRSPWDVSRDASLLYAGHRAAYLRYRHVPIVVGIDIYNLETEAYGAEIARPVGNGIPAVHLPLFQTLDQALAIEPFDPHRDGRIQMSIDVGRQLAADLPDADVRIPVAGPFSIAFNLRGISDLCHDVMLEPDRTRAFLFQLAENQGRLCQAIVDAGLDIAFFESAAAPPILSPTLFRKVEFPALKRMIQVAESIVGHPVPCIMGGDTFPILDEILETGTRYVICNVETDQLRFVERVVAQRPDVTVRVNMDPGVVACNDKERIHREIDRIVEITAGHPNCMLGTGALPYETPLANIDLIRGYWDSVRSE